MMQASMKVTDDHGVKPAPLSLAWEAVIPSASNRHPSPFSRGWGPYGWLDGGSHGGRGGSLNLKDRDTHTRGIIRVATMTIDEDDCG